ncbi:hypothetical protein BJ138DRAFT_1208638 [Hygrophoropsis aurantiaca]|uniref:Uncharacterized protein n=1 Tax=Hygrophoropsis aurantiaca TaxID=72124 RepID=A0ACB8A4F1_9AGAM|nr:hypothetical protein BJ138DRAFT_1208638 [Hygrophoropsis aurantiaca]
MVGVLIAQFGGHDDWDTIVWSFVSGICVLSREASLNDRRSAKCDGHSGKTSGTGSVAPPTLGRRWWKFEATGGWSQPWIFEFVLGGWMNANCCQTTPTIATEFAPEPCLKRIRVTGETRRGVNNWVKIKVVHGDLLAGDVKIYMAVNWGQTIFILSMQAILVIRVYALFNRSKKVLIFLATFYGLQTIATFVMLGFMFNKRALRGCVTSISPTIGSVTQDINLNSPSELLPFLQAMTILPVAFDTFVVLCTMGVSKARFGSKEIGGRMVYQCACENLDGGSFGVFCLYIVLLHSNLTWLSLMVAANYFTTELKVSGISFYTATYFFTALVVVVGPRMVISLRAVEKTRREGMILGTIQGTIRSGIREPLPQSETVMEIGGRLQATDEHCE